MFTTGHMEINKTHPDSSLVKQYIEIDECFEFLHEDVYRKKVSKLPWLFHLSCKATIFKSLLTMLRLFSTIIALQLYE